MKKTHIFIGLAILGVAVHFIETYDANAPCFEIVEAGKPLHGDILLDKCKGRTWTMVQDDTTLSELGYVVEDGEDEDSKAGDESEEVDILAAAEALESTEKSADEKTAKETQDEVSEETTDSSSDEDLTSLTVAELKARLKSAGKPVSGKKDELIARLQE